MKPISSTPSACERWIILVLGFLLAAGLVVSGWNIAMGIMQIVFIATAFLLVVLVVLIIAARRHGLRWMVSRRAWRFYGWLVVGIISAIVLFYAEENWRGKRAWAALKREAAARGESLDLASVFPPTVPDNENLALAPGMAQLFGYAEGESPTNQSGGATMQNPFPPLPGYRFWVLPADWALQRQVNLREWQEYFRGRPETKGSSGDDDDSRLRFPVSPEPQSPAADVLLALSRYDSALAVVRQAVSRPKARYPLDYERGLFGLMRGQHFAVQRFSAVAQVLCLRALAEFDQNQSEAALQDILLALRLADSLRQMPYQQCHNARIKMLLLCLQPVWEGLSRHRWNEQQLATLQQQFESLDLLTDFRHATRAEALVMMNLADQLQAYLDGRRSPAADEMRAAKGDDRWGIWLFRYLYPAGWLPQDKVWIYRFSERRADVFKTMAANENHSFTSELRSATDPCLLVFVVPRLKEMCAEGAEQSLFLQTACQEAATACALERYRLSHNGYPDSLEALVPAYLKRLPADHLAPTDAPLKYRRESDDRFVLYSIGLNRQDDNGKPGSAADFGPPREVGRGAFPRLNEGDWVWIQPEK